MKTKKVICITTLLFVILFGLPVKVQAANIGENFIIFGKLGDINNDKKIDSKDSTSLNNYLQGKESLSLFQKMRADVNRDLKINSNDTKVLNDYIKNTKIINVSSIKIAGATSIEVGKSTTLTATITPSNATNKSITWSSSNIFVATVIDGFVFGTGTGTAEIKAVCDNKTAIFKIEVKSTSNSKERISLDFNWEDIFSKDSKESSNNAQATPATQPTNNYTYSFNGKQYKTIITNSEISTFLKLIDSKDIHQNGHSRLSDACLRVAIYYIDILRGKIVINSTDSDISSKILSYPKPAILATKTNVADVKKLVDNKTLAVARVKSSGQHFVVLLGYTGEGTKFEDFLFIDTYYGKLNSGKTGLCKDLLSNTWHVRVYK